MMSMFIYGNVRNYGNASVVRNVCSDSDVIAVYNAPVMSEMLVITVWSVMTVDIIASKL